MPVERLAATDDASVLRRSLVGLVVIALCGLTAELVVDAGVAVATGVVAVALDASLFAAPPHAARIMAAAVRTFSTYLTSDGLREWDDATRPRRSARCMKSA